MAEETKREAWVIERAGMPVTAEVTRAEALGLLALARMPKDLLLVRYVPAVILDQVAPWKPIDELPVEWMDGRFVLVIDDEGDIRVAQWLQLASKWTDLSGHEFDPWKYMAININTEAARG